MKIKCINNTDVEGNLKLNEIYEPVKENKNCYVIQLSKGVKGNYLKNRFERVED